MTQPPNPEPAPFDPRALRAALGQFATGVTVIAAMHGDHMHAMTANSITSLSLDPPLIIFGLGKHTQMVKELRQAEGFSVNVLHEDQLALSSYFAGRWPEPAPPPFRFEPWEGGPRLAGCLAAIGCQVHEWLEGGDHWIVIGRVIALHQNPTPGRPLLFFGGAYRYLDAAELPAPDIDDDTPPVQIFYDPW